MSDTIATIPAGTWNVDPSHSRIGFTARHMMIAKVRGQFTDYTATVSVGEDPLQSLIESVVQMASIDTDNTDRDGHQRSNDFFDIATHPTMTLTSTRLEPTGNRYTLHANLTIKGVTRPVEFALDFDGTGNDPWGGTRAGFTAVTTIDRRDFNVAFNTVLETGGVLVGDKVTIELDIELVKAN
jgi:polyisoprenoid-binding protein YceI